MTLHSGSGSTGTPGWEDALGNQIANPTRNVLDIASHYSFSPERLRLFRNGSREFPQYNSVSQFSDNSDHWVLSPDAGDSMHIESAESGTYVVNYLMQASWAFQLNQSLSSGDILRFGPYNGSDGWYFEQRGADHSDTQGDIIEERNGSTTTLESNISLSTATTNWIRRGCQFGWYNVLNQTWRETTTNNGTASNDIAARTSNDNTRGPRTGNLNLWIEVEADANTTGLQLEVGSMGMVALGDPTSLNRNKPQFVELSSPISSADTWTPVYAIRIDPNDSDVNCQLSQVNVLDYGTASVEMIAVSVDPSKTDASDTDFGEPGYHHSFNSAIQDTTSISQVPNSSGTQTTLGSSEKPGGYTLAAAVDVDAGKSSESAATQNQARVEKKSILNSDQVVFLARSGTTGNTLQFVWDADQNY